MAESSIRVLVVDDYEHWRRFACSTLQKRAELQVISEVSDGLDAVQKAQELQPDLVLLDIGLPALNGIEAARRIRGCAPHSKILFVSENRSRDIVEAALSTGAGGYVVKSDAAGELLPAVTAVLDDKRFVSASLAGLDLAEPTDAQCENSQRKKVVAPFQAQKKICHEVEFYADNAGFVDGFARFIEAALKVAQPVIVIATESHHANLIQRLAADGLNVAAKIEEGSYIPLDVADALSSFMVDDSLDPVLVRKLASDLIMKAAKGAKGEHRQVAVCGEAVQILLAAGKVEATIMLERIWNEIAQHSEIDVLCAYFRTAFESAESVSVLERVCGEHSAARGENCC